MILKNRSFEKEEPTEEAKSIYIFCEGLKREYDYFKYFKEIDSRINIEIYKLKSDENNSPKGLFEIAKKCIIEPKENPNPKYSFQKNDEVWIVLDTDQDKLNSRKPQIDTIYNYCNENESWSIVQSNPCFEVWLFYHTKKEKPNFEGIEKCSNWKSFVNTCISGGFNPLKHPILIKNAIINSKNNFDKNENTPLVACTEVYLLGESMYSILKNKIEIN